MSFCNNSKKIYVGGRVVFKPCGKCALCRKHFGSELAFRFRKDVECWSEVNPEPCYSLFLTLTYDDNHVRIVNDPNSVEKFNFEEKRHFTACKEDLFLFKERVRSQLFRDLKKRIPLLIVSCTEYGDRTMRPHCHMVIHGIPMSYGRVYEEILEMFRSKWIDSKSKEPLGNIDLKVCDSGSVIYVVSYSIAGGDVDSLPLVCEKPTCQYSKGIGRIYFDKEQSHLKDLGYIPDYIEVEGKIQRLKRPFPRYFVRKYISTDKKYKRFKYIKDLSDRCKELTIKFGVSHGKYSYEEFANASFGLYSLSRIVAKLRRYYAAYQYLEQWPFLEESWNYFGCGVFDYERIFADDRAKSRFLRDYDGNRGCFEIVSYDALECSTFNDGATNASNLAIFDITNKRPINSMCRFFIGDALWCINHEQVCSSGRLDNLYFAYKALFEREMEDFIMRYESYISVFELQYKYSEDASVQAEYNLKSNLKGVL